MCVRERERVCCVRAREWCGERELVCVERERECECVREREESGVCV